jgi:hypothetical protein
MRLVSRLRRSRSCLAQQQHSAHLVSRNPVVQQFRDLLEREPEILERKYPMEP